MSAAFTQDINPLVAEISSGGLPGAANGQADSAALAALCFGLAGLAGHDGATWALALGAGVGVLGCVMSFLRLTVR